MKPRKQWKSYFKNFSSGSPTPPPGATCEFIGLPGSGKHIVAPIVRDELSARGWLSIPPRVDYHVDEESQSRCVNEVFSNLLDRQVQRLRSDGCRLPHVSEYVRHSASILSWSWSWGIRGSDTNSYFLDESLLHHFGPEIAELLASTSERTGRDSPLSDDASEILGKRRSVILTTSPRSEVLQRLESRRGKRIHWDWKSAYGDRLEEFLDRSENRPHSLVSALERLGVRITEVEVRGEKPEGSLVTFVRNEVTRIDEEMRYNT